jgi:AsmA protein
MLRKLLIGLAGLVGIIIIGLFALPAFISPEAYKPQIEKAASDSLGREVTIGAITKIAFLPNPKFTAENLVVANAPGMSDPYFVSVEEADIGVKLLPLLGRNVEISRFALASPDIKLEQKADGSANWVLGNGAPAAEDNIGGGGGTSPVSDIRLGTLTITNGAVSFRDGKSDQLFEAKEADITLTLNSLDKPLTVDGDMLFQGKPATLSAKVTTPRGLMENTAASIDLDFSVEDNKVDTLINLAGGDLVYDGRLNIEAPALKSLLATLGMSIDAPTGFNRLFVEGDVKGTSANMAFTGAKLTFDEITGTGDVAFDWGGAKPKLTGDVALTQLDLRPYMPEPSEAQKASREDKDAAFPPWPEDRLDFSALENVDAELKATTTGILLHNMEFGQSTIDVGIKNGTLNAQLRETNLYNGGGKGFLIINPKDRTPFVKVNLELKGLNAQNFASNVLGMNRLQGIGGLDTTLESNGYSVADFVSNLRGDGTFDVDEGAMEGVDIGKIITSANELLKGFQNGRFDPTALGSAIAAARGPASETRFSNLDSSFTVRNGQVQAQNIALKGPLFLITGNGTVDLPRQSMNMNFTPTVFETLEDEIGRKLGIPLQISGTFNEPKIGFDTSSLLRNAVDGRLKDVLGGQGIDVGEGESVEDALKNRARDELQGLLGGRKQEEPSTEEGETPPEEEEEKSLEDELKDSALDALFGKRKKKDGE